MKSIFALTTVALALGFSTATAEVTSKVTDVHLCCKGCVDGAEQAICEVPGVKAAADSDEGTVTITGPDTATVQKAADALVKAGYFGKSSDSSIKMNANPGAKGEKVKSLKVEGLHLCCGKCVKAVDRALSSTPGAKAHTAVKGAKSFQVTGEFNDKDFFTALQKEGLAGKIAK